MIVYKRGEVKMSNAVTLASKYRPKQFSDIVEQDSIKTILQNQIKSDDLKHAYLFCGSARYWKDHQC